MTIKYYNLLCLLFCLSISSVSTGQAVFTLSCLNSFESSENCQDNHNVNCGLPAHLTDASHAVFKFDAGTSCPSCTGTLINRGVSQNDLGYYFITAKHCINSADYSKKWNFVFNYQSRDCANSSVPANNKGGGQYFFQSRVELVKDVTLNDMAVLKILTPIPPHYNLYFAGWSISHGQATQLPYHIIHHPSADIKKYAHTSVAVAPTNQSCHIITKVVDVLYKVLFGWWTKTEIRTEKICSYTESPYYSVGHYSKGTTEPGSSGSPLINNNAHIIGVLSNGLSKCSFRAMDNYGRLNTGWNVASEIRNVLLPDRNFISFTTSLPGRRIQCYENLTLPGEQQYFPASDYQPQNEIQIQTRGTLTFSGLHTFHPGSDVVFSAESAIVTTPGTVWISKPGSSIELKIGASCGNSQRTAEIPETDIVLQDLPEHKSLNIQNIAERYGIALEVSDSNPSKAVYPNPIHSGILYFNKTAAVYQLLNAEGILIAEGFDADHMTIGQLAKGLYILNLDGQAHKVIIE